MLLLSLLWVVEPVAARSLDTIADLQRLRARVKAKTTARQPGKPLVAKPAKVRGRPPAPTRPAIASGTRTASATAATTPASGTARIPRPATASHTVVIAPRAGIGTPSVTLVGSSTAAVLRLAALPARPSAANVPVATAHRASSAPATHLTSVPTVPTGGPASSSSAGWSSTPVPANIPTPASFSPAKPVRIPAPKTPALTAVPAKIATPASDLSRSPRISPHDVAVVVARPGASPATAIGPHDLAMPVAASLTITPRPIPQAAGAAEKLRTVPVPKTGHPWLRIEDPMLRSLNISGAKTFEMKKADVSGDVGHFSTENFSAIPGFRLDQSLHLEIDGNISNSATVHAVLDDKQDEDRRFTVNIDGPVWDFTMGDFPLFLEGTEFSLHQKEVRGVLAKGAFHPKFQSLFLYSQSKGSARREQFRGAGDQQEFRLLGQPVVQGSERVLLDGRLLARGTDYLVDYEDGIIKFQPHLLPIEMTRWVVVEYEVSDKKLAFQRNMFGTRQIYRHGEHRHVGLTWIREMDNATPKSDDVVEASGTVRPMQHDVVAGDVQWQLRPGILIDGETSMSLVDPNRNSDETDQDRTITGQASRFSLKANLEKLDGELTLRQIGKEFQMIGRDGGVAQLGERGLVNDILQGTGRFSWKWRPTVTVFGGLEESRTNLSNTPGLSRVDFQERNGGLAWRYHPKSRLELRYGLHTDRERQETLLSNRDRGAGALVWDHQIGTVFTQTKVEHTAYADGVNPASDSRVLQADVSIGSDHLKWFTWTLGASQLAVDDKLDPDRLRSETQNYSLDLNFEPNRVLQARGIFQFRQEDDFFANSRQDSQIADSRLRYQPNRDWQTQVKYKVENTSKVTRDPNLDPTKYIQPPSLPVGTEDPAEVVGRFENPVQKSTTNITNTYRIRENLESYVDWRHRDLKDKSTKLIVSENDRKSYELRWSPLEKLRLTTEYEQGMARSIDPRTELRDTLKRLECRNEFFAGYIIDARLEEAQDDDIYDNNLDKTTLSKALDFQRVFSRFTTLEFGLQRNIITSVTPSREWEKRLAFIITPSARNQRYRLFMTHKSIEAEKSGEHLEGGVVFSQFIGTDTMIDGELKKVKSTAGLNGGGYDGFVANAKMVVTF